MSNLLQFGGATRPPASIVNAFSTAGATPVILTNAFTSGKVFLSGALTANTLATATGLSQVNGSGKIRALWLITNDATARTLRLKLTIDGVSCFDAVSASVSTNERGVIAVGSQNGPSVAGLDQSDGVFYNSSFLVQIASSLSETDKISVGIAYETFS